MQRAAVWVCLLGCVLLLVGCSALELLPVRGPLRCAWVPRAVMM